MARILMVMRPDRGGVFTHVRRLGSALVEAGHDVGVAGPLRHRAADLSGIRVLPVDIPREIEPAGQLRALRGVAGAIRAFKPDLIHAHGSQGGVLARLSRPVLPTVPLVFTPHLYAFDNHFADQRYRAMYRGIERALAPLATRVLCVCESEAALARRIGSASRVRMVHNGTPVVDVTNPDPRLGPAGSGPPTIGTVAELRRSKAVPVLVEAFTMLASRFPDLRLAIAGDGPERHETEEAVAASGVADRIVMLGATPGPGPLLGAIDVFVNPAFAEAFPYTVIEAMSAGLPVVATDVGGTAEAVIDGLNGRLVDPGDPAVLAEAIADVLSDPERMAEFGAASRELHERNFTVERMVAGTLAVYGELF